jgi:hypothetical protein
VSKGSKAVVCALMLAHSGCEFKDETRPIGGLETASAGTDLTFVWNDESGTREIIRSFETQSGELHGSVKIALAKVPDTITIKGNAVESRDCSAKLWVNGDRPAQIECVSLEGRNEIKLRGVSLAIPSGIDGLHPIRIETGTHAINFGFRALPTSVPLTSAIRSSSVSGLGFNRTFHQVAAFEIPKTRGGRTLLLTPTQVPGILRRKIVSHSYSSDFLRCSLDQTSVQADQDQAVEIQLIQERPTVLTEWPKLFALDKQVVDVSSDHAARLLAFVTHPLLDQVFGGIHRKESSTIQRIEEPCHEPNMIYSTVHRVSRMHRDLRIGNDESDPVLLFTLTGVTALDAGNHQVDQKPVGSSISNQSFEIIISKDAQ